MGANQKLSFLNCIRKLITLELKTGYNQPDNLSASKFSFSVIVAVDACFPVTSVARKTNLNEPVSDIFKSRWLSIIHVD